MAAALRKKKLSIDYSTFRFHLEHERVFFNMIRRKDWAHFLYLLDFFFWVFLLLSWLHFFLSSLRLIANGGHGSIITASRSSSKNMKTVVDQKLSVQRIIWPKLLTGHYLVPMKEALIPRTQDIREKTNQRIFLDVEIMCRILKDKN